MTNRNRQWALWLAGWALSGAAWSADIAPVGQVRLAADKAPSAVSSAAAKTPSPAPTTPSKSETPPPQAAPVTNKKAASKPSVAQTRKTASGANRFNRLLKPPSQRNPPPASDGIHDPDNDGTHMLQPPKDAFSALPKANSGNRVNWVTALEKGGIAPRFDRIDPDKKPIILDLNIVREVKGSMPDVVYPHKQHTEWLDCSNCHPAIFIPKKGANDISMASILLGEKCGVCHGKVAFPVAECRKCHSKNKPRNAGSP